MAGTTFDVNQLALDADGQTLYIAGRGGVWVSPDAGASYHPAGNQLAGGDASALAANINGGCVANDTDYKGTVTTDRYQTVTRLSSRPSGLRTGFTRTVQGIRLQFIPAKTGTPCKLLAAGMDIADDFLRGAGATITALDVAPDDLTIYLSASGGGVLVKAPA
jgi:hypothetical protein